jgi:hypothetical protein
MMDVPFSSSDHHEGPRSSLCHPRSPEPVPCPGGKEFSPPSNRRTEAQRDRERRIADAFALSFTGAGHAGRCREGGDLHGERAAVATGVKRARCTLPHREHRLCLDDEFGPILRPYGHGENAGKDSKGRRAEGMPCVASDEGGVPSARPARCPVKQQPCDRLVHLGQSLTIGASRAGSYSSFSNERRNMKWRRIVLPSPPTE